MNTEKSFVVINAFDIVGKAPLEVVTMIFEYLGHTSAMNYQQVSKMWKHKLSSDAVMKASLSTWSTSGDLKLSCEAQDKRISKSKIFRKRVEQIQRFRLGIPHSQTCIPLEAYGTDDIMTRFMVHYKHLTLCGDVVAWAATYAEGYSRMVAHNLKTSWRVGSEPCQFVGKTNMNSQYLGWLSSDHCMFVNLATSTSFSVRSILPFGPGRFLNTFHTCDLVGDGHIFAIHTMWVFDRDRGMEFNEWDPFPIQLIDANNQNSWVVNLVTPCPRSEDSGVGMQLRHVHISAIRVDALAETFTLLKIMPWKSGESSGMRDQHVVWRGQFSLDGNLITSYYNPLELDLETPSAALYSGRSTETDMADGRLTPVYCRPYDSVGESGQETFHMVLSDRRSSQLVTKLRYRSHNLAYDIRSNCHRAWKDVEVFVHKYRVLFKRSRSEIDFLSDNADRPDSCSDYAQKEMGIQDFLYPGCAETAAWTDARNFRCNEWFFIVFDRPRNGHYGRIHVSCFDPDFEFPTPANLALQIEGPTDT